MADSIHPMVHEVVELAREFGGEAFVRGGGGNASYKDDDTLWIKPSGTSLSDLRVDQFVAMDRRRLEALHAYRPAEDWRQRERDVKEVTSSAILPDSGGGPSIDTALHNFVPHAFGLHTHPALVNALACGVDGQRCTHELLPEALWVPSLEPGFMLYVRVRAEMEALRGSARKSVPRTLILRNQGLFVSGDTADEIRDRMRHVMDVVAGAVREAGVPSTLAIGPEPEADAVGEVFDRLQSAAGPEASVILPSGPFRVPEGAISPDHVVYARASSYQGMPTVEGLEAFHARHGYWPRVVSTDTGVYGVGRTHKAAALALEFAMDGALVVQCARAFGGVVYMSDDAVRFIEQWEVENYRRKGAL